jgi:hypothetical protein
MITITNYSVELIWDSQVFSRNLAIRRLTDQRYPQCSSSYDVEQVVMWRLPKTYPEPMIVPKR